MTHRIHNLGQRARRLSLAALLALTILAGGGAAMAAHALQANAPAAIYPWRPGMYAAPRRDPGRTQRRRARLRHHKNPG